LNARVISYSPHDSSFNVFVAVPDAPARELDWTVEPPGRFGISSFRLCGILLTLGIFGFGWRWLRSQHSIPLWSKCGYALLVLFSLLC